MAETIDQESITIVDGEFAPVNQLPAALQTNIAAIRARSQEALTNVDLEKDFDFSRTNLIQALNTGLAALEELSEIARQSQHPRSYEVLALLLKNLSDVNDKLLDLHEKKMELTNTPSETDEGTGDTVRNNYFVGSTTELLQLLNSQKK